MKYTPTQLRVIYKALKGANLLGSLASDTGYNRQSIWNTFNAPDVQYVEIVVAWGLKLLRSNGILQDIQTLTEILN
jgi:hypothetical protein